jgi:MFS family permease
VNVGFAKQHMERDLGFGDATYGFGAGLFFVGYFLFEVPSNLILHRVGARLWIGRIMVSWGLVSAAMVFGTSEAHFYGLRLLLGLAEAGFFPGVILYLTYWYPAARRAKVTSLFMTGMAIAGIVGGPLSGWLLKAFGEHPTFRDWQWMYLLEGLPSVLVGLLALAYLDDGIEHAKWLTAPEKALLRAEMDKDVGEMRPRPLGEVLRSGKLWIMAFLYFCLVMGVYGISFWLPTLIASLGVQDSLKVGLFSAIPWAFAALTMVVVAHSSDRLRERRWHLAGASACGAFGLVLAVKAAGAWGVSMVALTLATMGITTSLPLFWSLPTAFLAGTGAAAGIAIINSLGNLAGFVSPYVVGWLRETSGSADSGMYLLAGCLVVAAAIAVSIPAKLVNR